jgi:Fe-S oxidoreductase
MKQAEIANSLESCVECHNCEECCSIYYYTGKYSVLEKLDVLEQLQENQQINVEQINTIFFCTKCEACQEACPQDIPLMELFDWGRTQIFSKYGARNTKQARLIQNILGSGNPFGSEESRLEGISEDLIEGKVLDKPDSTETTTLLHLGCMLGYRLHTMRDDIIEILNILNINYKILGNEQCCGYFIFNTGDHDSATVAIERNADLFEQFDRIICACAGCFIFFKENYPHPEKFVHIIEVIDKNLESLHQEGILKMKKTEDQSKTISFHDSCHLTRPFGITEPPRRILNLLGYSLNEFEYSKKKGLCCGADGGMRITNPDLAVKIGKERVREALDMGSNSLMTLCPFCIFNFREASKDLHKLKIQSLYTEILKYLKENL